MASVNYAQLARRAVSYAAVKHIPLANRCLSRATHGRVNTHSLAGRVWHSGVKAARAYAVENKLLGERSATVVPLLVRAFVDNNADQMGSAIRELASDALGVYVRKDAPGVEGWIGGPLHTFASDVAEKLAVALLGDHAAEKVLATMVKRHGLAPVKQYFKDSLGEFPGRGFVIRQVLKCLTDVLNDPRHARAQSAEYDALADMLHVMVRGGSNQDYLDVLKGYAPNTFATVSALWQMQQGVVRAGTEIGQAASAIVETGRRVIVQDVPAAIDGAQQALGALAPCSLEQAYGAWPTPAPGSLSTSAAERDIADAMLRTRFDLASRMPDLDAISPAAAHKRVLLEVDVLAGGKAHDMSDRIDRVADALSPAQLMPLGPRGETQVARTWTGHLAQVHATNHSWLPKNGKLDGAIERALDMAPTDYVKSGQYVVSRDFLSRLDDLKLDFGDGKPAAQGTALLDQLFNACGRDAVVMREATRFLSDELALRALVKPTVSMLRDASSGLLDVGGTMVRLARPAAPEYRFEVRGEAGFVRVGIDAKWPITAYGPSADALRAPRGAQTSCLVASAGVSIRRPANSVMSDTASVTTRCDAMGARATIDNLIAFDARSGAILGSVPTGPASNAKANAIWLPHQGSESA